MLQKTRGIVFHTVRFSETSVIAKIFTEEFGIQSVVVNSVRSKKAKTRSASLQPLTLLDLVLYRKEEREIQRISEIKISQPFQTIHTDIRKSSTVLFLADMLRRSVKEEEANQNLFEFIFQSLLLLDLRSEGIGNFHLLFLLQLTRHLGFFPSGKYSEATPVFNLQEGMFQQSLPLHGLFLEKKEAEVLSVLLNSNYDSLSSVEIPNALRKNILEKIVDYYRLHIASFHEIHSHEILGVVMASVH